MRLKEAIVGRARNGLLVLLAAVFAVLLIACANVANLQLAHGSARQHELGIKAALGARRGRLVRQLVTESLVLAGLGGGIGLVLGYGMRSFLAVRTIPRAESVSFDWPVFAFALAVSSFAAVVFGLAPALSLSSSGIARSIVGGSSHRATRRSGTRSILVGLEVTVSLVLLVSAALLLKSLSALQSVEPGFSPERVATMQVSLPIARYPEGDQIPFYDDLLRRIRALPGVSHAGAINILPLSANYSSDGFQVEERPVPPGEKPSAEARSVDREYFEAMGIPLIRGRLFDERDRPGSPGVIVVSEQMASKFWPGEDPIGKRITYNRALPEDESKEVGGPGSREIVGVVGDVKHLGLDDADVAMFYTPRTHHPSFHTMTLVIRGEIDVDVVAAAVRDAVRAMDPEVPVYAVRSLNEVIESTVAGPRYRTILLGSFAAFALILALVGVYAVMGLLVSQRTREIGIRMALGARAGDVVRMLVSESMKPVLWGIAIGLSAALSLSRYLASLLFRVEPRDPAVYLTVTGLLAAAALASALLPSLRATRIDPTRSLQTEDGARLE